MSEAAPEDIAHALAASDRHAYVEQRIFVYSPFGTLATALLIFAVLAGSFAVAWEISGRPFLIATDTRVYVGTLIRLALWFCLILSTVLGMQRYVRVKDREDIGRYAAVLRGSWESAARISQLTPNNVSLVLANIAGLAIGLGASWFFFMSSRTESLLGYPALLAWFTVVATLLALSFARGVALTRAGGRNVRKTIEDELVIDLLRIDRLTVIGRSASRPALIWFAVSAVILVIFIGGGITPFTVTFLVVCAAMGIWVFVATMEHVHRRILSTKAAELEHLRGEIDALRARAADEADCSVRLQGLLAYEARIMAAPEWPFDQTTLVRVCASALILTVPWFGQAVAAYVVDHLSRIGG